MIRHATLVLLALALPASAQTVDAPFAERFAAFAPVAQRSTGPTLKPAATVVGNIVRIGDLVDNAGAAAHVAIFRAPDLGQTGRLPASRVIEALTPHAVNLDAQGVTEVVVTRASSAITSEDIEERILRALAGRHRVADAGNLTLSFDGEIRTIHVEPATDLRLARVTFDPRSGRFDALFERPDGARNFIRFTGTYAETFEAAVLVRPLAAGDIVKASDLALARRPKAQLAANVVTRTEDAVGLATRRPLRSGDLLRQADLAKPEVVSRNDNVTITYHVPGIALTMRGKALEAGTHGEVIHVLNEQSKRTIQATVAGRGHVVVNATARVINVTSNTTAPRLAADATGRPNSNPRASAQ